MSITVDYIRNNHVIHCRMQKAKSLQNSVKSFTLGGLLEDFSFTVQWKLQIWWFWNVQLKVMTGILLYFILPSTNTMKLRTKNLECLSPSHSTELHVHQFLLKQTNTKLIFFSFSNFLTQLVTVVFTKCYLNKRK